MKRLLSGLLIGALSFSAAACTPTTQNEHAPTVKPEAIDDERLHGEPFQGFEKTKLCEATYAATIDEMNIESDDAPLDYPSNSSGKEQVFCADENYLPWDSANAEIIFKVGFATIPPGKVDTVKQRTAQEGGPLDACNFIFAAGFGSDGTEQEIAGHKYCNNDQLPDSSGYLIDARFGHRGTAVSIWIGVYAKERSDLPDGEELESIDADASDIEAIRDAALTAFFTELDRIDRG
ncbi:MAG TPA: hypothetical protein H9902_09535 [Candidatus Stackebrandtia faecavium]|nr:hypothetical protein [Candidatus Stackebrandtia faecavium]